MPTEYVLDASALCKLFLDEPGAKQFRFWYRERRRERCRFLAPGLLPYELANVIHQVKGNTPVADDPEYMRGIVADAVQGVELDEQAWRSTWHRAGRLTAYDAAYAALAERLGATLVTYDDRLAGQAAQTVPVIGGVGLEPNPDK